MEKTCPQCGGEMTAQESGVVRSLRCGDCRGVFLSRSDVADLVEAENDWHSVRSADTARLPRITPDMTAPPPTLQARAWVETLFG